MQSESITVFIVAAYCSSHNSKWFSPGRQRKLDQVKSLLTSMGANCFELSIAPFNPEQRNIQAVSLCRDSWPPIRLIQLFFNALLLGRKIKSTDEHQWIWLYNTRMAEALVALALLLRKPSLKLFLQLEDLPAARQANAGLRGWLDGISTVLLSKRANGVSAVSPSVAEAFHHLTGFPSERIVLLPPLLDEAYQQKLAQRSSPFQNSYHTIVYAGGYTSEKGVDELLTAFQLIDPNHYRLLLLGPIPNQLRAQLVGIHGIEVLGMVSNEKLFSAYSEADIVVNPHQVILNSDYIFPFKLVEILASGALPLTTAMPGLDVYNLPRECLFSDSQELAKKLITAPSIWRNHRVQIDKMTKHTRKFHSIELSQKLLKNYLSKNQ